MVKTNNNIVSNKLSKVGRKLLATTAVTAVGFLSMVGDAQAQNDWTDHSVVGGNGSINIDTSTANTTNITQTGHRVKVQGDGDIKSGWTVNVNQESKSSQYILFDVENDPTHIQGSLNATGEVIIFDNDGIIFSADSQVNVGSIVASSGTLASTDAQLDDGKLIINSSDSDGEVRNRGSITVSEAGLAAFVAPSVDNSGVINAKMGTVAMAAGETVTLDMYGDGLVEVAVSGELADGLVKNTGTINADGGNVLISAAIAKDAVDDVINMNGVTTVSSATVKGGKIILSGGDSGRVNVTGKVTASGGAGQKAGSVKVTGERIRIKDDATVLADADSDQEAGDISIIASEELAVDGTLSAQGLAGSGVIETSSALTRLGINSSVLATREWLLGSANFNITEQLALVGEDQLAVGDWTVFTNTGGTDAGNISVESTIDWNTTNTLTLAAHNDVVFDGIGGVNATSAGNLVMQADGNVRLEAGHDNISTNGGDVTVTAGNEFLLDGGSIDANGGDIKISNNDTFTAPADSITTSGEGTVEISQNKDRNGNGESSIQNAIDAISNTGTGTNTVNVGAGTWFESVEANTDNLVLKGTNAGTHGSDESRVPETVIDPNSPAVHVTADNVTIDGFTLTGADDGVLAENADNLTVRNNIITNVTENGVKVVNGRGALIERNNFSDVTGNGVDTNKNALVRILDNDFLRIGGHGVNATSAFGFVEGGNVVVSENTFEDIGAVTDAGNAINIRGVDRSNITDNAIKYTTADGINVNNFIASWISYNDIDFTQGNGIYVENGDFVSIYDNYIESAGYINGFAHGFGEGLNETASAADGIHVREVSGVAIPEVNESVIGFGSSTYGSAVEIYGNDVAITSDDGIQVEENHSAYIANNIVGHAVVDGIDIDDTAVAVVRDNAISTVGEFGISIYEGDGVSVFKNEYAGVFDNRILLAGIDGIKIQQVHGGAGAMTLGDEVYGFGWSVNVSGNEVAMVGESAISVTDSGPTSISDNTVFMAGMGDGLVEAIDNINQFASGTFSPVYTVTALQLVEPENQFKWSWNNSFGIDVQNITGAENSPNGYAVDVSDNDVTYTGGHGISVARSDRTRIQGNDVQYAGLIQTTMEGQTSMMNALNYGPFDRTNEGRRNLWVEDGEMIDVLDSYFGTLQEEPSDEAYVTISNIIFDNFDGIHAEKIFNSNVVVQSEIDTISDESYEGESNPFALVISDNEVQFTGDDGIEVADSGRTLIEGNRLRDSGYGVLSEDAEHVTFGYDGADSIHVTNVQTSDEEFYDYELGSNYGLVIRDNDIARAADDGIQVEESSSAFIADNVIDNVEADGIDVDYTKLSVVRDNDIATVGEFGVSVYEGQYAGVFDNRILLAGIDGIRLQQIHGSDTNYGYGWSTDVSGNEVAMTGESAISVTDSGSTKITENSVFMAGMGDGLVETIDTLNQLASGNKKLTKKELAELENQFEQSWNNSFGIDVQNITGASDSPNNYAVDVSDNDVKYTGGHGVSVARSDRTRIQENNVQYAGLIKTTMVGQQSLLNAVSEGLFDSSDEEPTTLEFEDGEMFDVLDSYFVTQNGEPREGGSVAISNIIFDNFDGIHAEKIFNSNVAVQPEIQTVSDENYEGGSNPFALTISDNIVEFTGDDGIEVTDSERTLIADNDIDSAGYGFLAKNAQHVTFGYDGADGIRVTNVAGSASKETDIVTDISPEEAQLEEADNYELVIHGNNISGVADDGIEITASEDQNSQADIIVKLNEIENSGDNGIALITGGVPTKQENDTGVSLVATQGGLMNSRVLENNVTNSENNGLLVGGPSHDSVLVAANTVTDSDIGANFESGQIDLTGETNTINDSRIGLRFAPAEYAPSAGEYEDVIITSTDSVEPTFADMSLLDNTIGTTVFDGQSSFFVELDNGAFFAPGTPTLLSANDATFVGTPFGDITPNVTYPGGLPSAELGYLESKFQHFIDDNTLGLFFLQPESLALLGIDQEDIFLNFGPFADSLGGLNVTILPTANAPTPLATPTDPAALNNIATAAGGEETSAEDLNNIEAAAGGSDTTCWGDAVGATDNGQSATINSDGTAAGLLDDEASCSTNSLEI